MNKPIILDNAIIRTGDDVKPFVYDHSLNMNVIKLGKESRIFIDIENNADELFSKTEATREKDDELNTTFSELETKTRVSRESDDDSFHLLELKTFTHVASERDDEENRFVELTTKTFIERERDDEESISYN